MTSNDPDNPMRKKSHAKGKWLVLIILLSPLILYVVIKFVYSFAPDQ